jgi:hypothetical protein
MMILIVAALMAIGALAFPIAVDIKKHGRDNILRRSGREILEFHAVAAVSDAISDFIRKIVRIIRVFIRKLVRTVQAVIQLVFWAAVVLLIWWILKLINVL